MNYLNKRIPESLQKFEPYENNGHEETPSLSNNIVPSRFRVPSRNIISVALVALLKIGSSAL